MRLTEDTIHGIVAMLGDDLQAMNELVDYIENNPTATEAEVTKAASRILYLVDCGGIQPEDVLSEDGTVEVCGGIPMEIAPMLENDKDSTKPMNEQQKTIHEKWEEGEITILPPIEE